MTKPYEIDEAEFAAWVGEQPPKKRYDYWATGNGPNGCAVTQFAETRGIYDNDSWQDLHDKYGPAASEEPWTFGALSTRLAEQVSP